MICIWRLPIDSSSLAAAVLLTSLAAPLAVAQERAVEIRPSEASLRSQLDEARKLIADQDQRLSDQERRIRLLEQHVAGRDAGGQPSSALVADGPAGSQARAPGISPERPAVVGEAPADQDRAPAVAVLDERGSVLTRRGQLVGEFGLDYSRSDRNRAVFRGVELLESILVGVFDINESRQDILTGSASLRYGLGRRLEIGARLPVLYRSDMSIVAPVAGSTNDDAARTIDSSVRGGGVGDVEVTARYQLNDGGRNAPFLIANLQAVFPTGRSPFDVRRDENGSAQEVATGAGFVGVSPSITAILPSEPAVLFGTLGYTKNLAADVMTRIPPVEIDRVDPGDSINLAAGIGLALNDRTSLSLGYAHSWAFGTTTWTRLLDEQSGEPTGEKIVTRSRDLQAGRLLLGVTQRFARWLNINWSIEVGATEDAPDLRTMLRVPIIF
jgi:hypothetical protein